MLHLPGRIVTPVTDRVPILCFAAALLEIAKEDSTRGVIGIVWGTTPSRRSERDLSFEATSIAGSICRKCLASPLPSPNALPFGQHVA